MKSAVQTAFKSVIAIVLVGFVISYIVIFKAYKTALSNHEQLINIFNHPNARVASGDKVNKVLATV
jgi:hypothetical protein